MACHFSIRILRLLPTFLGCLVMWLALTVAGAGADDSKVAVVVSSEIRPFVLSLEGFRSEFDGSIDLSYLSANPELVRHRLNTQPFDTIVAIGPAASKLVWETVEKKTKVALMVLDPGELLEDPAPCCVDLRIPMDDQIRLVAEQLGTPRHIGILYNPSENEAWIDQGRRAGERYGVKVVPLPVNRRDEVKTALSSAYDTIDTLLFIPDSTVISETLVTHLVKDALLHGVASVGYNHFFLEIGAALAFVIDYEAVGAHGAKLAREIMGGRPCGLNPPPFRLERNERALGLIERNKRQDGDRRTGGLSP